MSQFERGKPIFRAWFYFRNGWSLYFAFIFAAINTLTVTYYLAIDKIPELLNIFPSFSIYVGLVMSLGIPILVLIGYIHYKRSPAYKSEASIGYEVNPYIRRNLINSELSLDLNLKILDLIIKLSNKEELNKDNLNEIKKDTQNLSNLIKKRTITDNYDIEHLKKIINKK
jgi:hypothetical protein